MICFFFCTKYTRRLFLVACCPTYLLCHSRWNTAILQLGLPRGCTFTALTAVKTYSLHDLSRILMFATWVLTNMHTHAAVSVLSMRFHDDLCDEMYPFPWLKVLIWKIFCSIICLVVCFSSGKWQLSKPWIMWFLRFTWVFAKCRDGIKVIGSAIVAIYILKV